ncbi:LamB/YcsF family protein [Vibrio sinensis]|uniref:5-oxoprolinase subunit A n=1 Tax=Vibrio sinensis TaxID=2302434 RepID=A0A3A6R2G3_9VIBR|nr:5-oxoprolinase subunit PxpA [Vibrio sinensis]RJX75524.1 LamB/YcsF family protein [Vibrio sinensis]
MSKGKITLNCDMGESYGAWKMGDDQAVMPFVDMANIACGFHASDPSIMIQTITLALQNNVQIGAHPSYPDLQGFGRRSLAMTPNDITQNVIYQIGALRGLCQSVNTDVEYVKPHGALYNDMMVDESIFEAIIDAVSCFNLPLMMLATQTTDQHLDIADRYDVPLLFEAFADRTYLSDGSLAPRNLKGAVLDNEDDILNQVKQIAQYGKVRTLDGCSLLIEADTICVHGDNEASIALIKKIRHALLIDED